MTLLSHEPGISFSRITRRTSTLLPGGATTCWYPQFRTFPAVAPVAAQFTKPFDERQA